MKILPLITANDIISLPKAALVFFYEENYEQPLDFDMPRTAIRIQKLSGHQKTWYPSEIRRQVFKGGLFCSEMLVPTEKGARYYKYMLEGKNKRTVKQLPVSCGQKMGVAKAALKFFYEEFGGDMLSVEDKDAIIKIAVIAGCDPQAYWAPVAMIMRLRCSPLWTYHFPDGSKMVTGKGHVAVAPTVKGKIYYETMLKDTTVYI